MHVIKHVFGKSNKIKFIYIVCYYIIKKSTIILNADTQAR